MMNKNLRGANQTSAIQSMESLLAEWSKVSQTIHVEISMKQRIPLDRSDEFPDGGVTEVIGRCPLTGMCVGVGYGRGTYTKVALQEALACMLFPKISYGQLI